jgi:glutamine amidotransferase
MKVVIIDYGAGNIKSIQFAFERLGVSAKLTHNVDEISAADRVIFPGVGQAADAMDKLKNSTLDRVIPTLQQPVLGICLGMQLLCNSTEEGSTPGLGIFDVDVKRFNANVNVPQIGWNTIHDLTSDLFVEIPDASYMYLVHSYYAELCKDTIASSRYGLTYSTALKKDNFYGVQFHPEKSSALGARILNNFLNLKL